MAKISHIELEGSKVLDFHKIDDLAHALKYPRIRRLLLDWDRWRGNRDFPGRSDFYPEDLGYILGYLTLSDVVPAKPVRFRYRLYGSEIGNRRAFDMTGRFVDQHPEPELRALVENINCEVISKRRPVWREHGVLETVFDLSHFGVLSLPLSEDGVSINMIVSAQIFLKEECRFDRRLPGLL